MVSCSFHGDSENLACSCLAVRWKNACGVLLAAGSGEAAGQSRSSRPRGTRSSCSGGPTVEMEMLRKGVSERGWWWCELEEWRFCDLQVVAGRNQETLGKREGGALIPRVPVGLRLGADDLGERGDIKVLGHVGGGEFWRERVLVVSERTRVFDWSFQIQPGFCPHGVLFWR